MKICFMCDLHLPSCADAIQYNVLKWAVEDAVKKAADCIVFAGDATCYGDRKVYSYFVNTVSESRIPFLYIPGNSDLRSPETLSELYSLHSPVVNDFYDFRIFAVNDSDADISDDTFEKIESADRGDIVFMHHPLCDLNNESAERMRFWRKTHPEVFMFCGHMHQSKAEGYDVYLQAMDPDKAIGENPCITYFDTETGNLRKAYYFSAVPTDLYNYLGISCYNPVNQIEFAIKNRLASLELRPDCINVDENTLSRLIGEWRLNGGANLSVHMPDVFYKDGQVCYPDSADKLISVIKALDADRITQHVPVVSVSDATDEVLDKICLFLSERFENLGNIVIGIENMHMTPSEKDDEKRRFGYTPYECKKFIDMMSAKTKHRVGFNFDIGHARNNAPYSSIYQLGTWMALLGKKIVGYHIHQVTLSEKGYENHMPITDIYGKLISYCSFFRNWTEGCINKAPVVFEMRGEDSYAITLDTFNKHRCNIFDIHSHTYYSDCGRDNPVDLINTAVNNGVSLLGISDHSYGIGDRKEDYYNEMISFRKDYEGVIRILCGIEVNTLLPYFDINKADDLSYFDYCLLESVTSPESLAGADLIGFCKKLGVLCGIAHTDMFEYCDMYGYNPEEYFRLLAENNIFWEMNVSYDSIHKYREHQYVFDFMNDENKQKAVRDSGLAVSIGCDSHRCEDYDGYKVHMMYHFLKDKGIRTADELFEITV